MKQRKALKPFHAFLRDGVIVDVGDGDYSPLAGCEALEFDTKKARALHPLVAQWELENSISVIEQSVSEMKSDDAYSEKEAQAVRLLENVKNGALPDSFELRDSLYGYIADEVDLTGLKPLKVARLVVAAAERERRAGKGRRAQECERLKLREIAKRARATTSKKGRENG